MSREFNRYVEKQFARRMQTFDLEPAKAAGPIAWPGERCFRTRGSATVCWICVFPDSKGLNAFNVELAWSHDGAYPQACTSRPSLRGDPPDCFAEAAGGFVRLGNLASPPRGSWGAATQKELLAILSPESAAALADPLIDDAIRIIEVVGLPLAAQAISARAAYLASVVQRQCGSGT